ncbi:uncharacterized protein LOC142344115 [Convolutriloba macropyga]|uniref:uncharacterized protein LOC142344115 n=1 Tax=Convolutriloba macropyga TaxID=536237 RepID=UPI003F5252BE
MDEGFENATIAESANVTFGQFGPMMQSYNDDEDAALKGLIKFVFIFIRLVIQVGGICSSVVVILCVYKFPYLRQAHNVIVCSLSVSDLLFLLYETIFRIPRDIAMHFKWYLLPIRPWVCQLNFVQNCLISTQLAHMLLVAIDRFLFINWPLHYSFGRRKTHLMGGIVTAWIIGIIPISVVNTIICSDFTEERALAFAARVDISHHIVGHSTLVWFLTLFLIYSSVFWRLEKYVKLQRRMWKREISPPTRFERNRFIQPERGRYGSGVGHGAHVEQLIRNSEREKAILRGYAVRMICAFVPQFLRYCAMMVAAVTDSHKGSQLVGRNVTSLVFKQVVLLTVITSAAFSASIHCFSQSRLKNAARKLLTREKRTEHAIPMMRRDNNRANGAMRGAVGTTTPRVTPLTPAAPLPNVHQHIQRA